MTLEEEAIEGIRGTKRTTCECGSDEFITQLNAYDVYATDDEGILQYFKTESTNEPNRYFCRECGQEYDEDLSPVRDEE